VGEGGRDPLKRLLLGLAALVLVVASAGAAFVLYRLHQQRNIRGSSTEEFVTTETTPAEPIDTAVRWPMFGFDVSRKRAPDGVRLRPPFRTRWYVSGGALIEFPPAVAYGRLYFANRVGTLYAVATHRPRVEWKFHSGRCAAASPAVSHHLVYMAFLNRPPCNKPRPGLDGEVVALDAKNGRVRWRRTIGPSESSPLVAQGRVYLGDWNGKVYALAARSGRTVWTATTGGKVKGGVTLSGNRIFVGAYDSHLYAFDSRTGRQLWRASAQERLGSQGTFYSTPAAAYGRVYIGSTDGKMYSFGAESGKIRWSHSTGGYVYASPAVWRGRVLAGSYDGNFYAFDAATGDVRWRFRANGHVSGSAVVIDGVVYCSTLRGRTYALDAATGKLLWDYRRGAYAAVVSDRMRLFLVGVARVFALTPG
jgi:outer membrane protein assembly factor BamB